MDGAGTPPSPYAPGSPDPGYIHRSNPPRDCAPQGHPVHK